MKLQQSKPFTYLTKSSSTGIQILPSVQPIVKKITVFIRSPTWISPPVGMDQRPYTVEEQRLFTDCPTELTKLRKANETKINGLFQTFLQGSALQNSTRAEFTQQMRVKLSKLPWLQEKLIPDWSVGCRRLTPGINYLEAFSKSNVDLIFGEIDSITDTSVKCHDKEVDVDVLICATGFDTSFCPRFPLIGRQQHNLQDGWAQEPTSYLGLAAGMMPNYFHFLGPNCPIGNGPVIIAIEKQADYMLTFCNRWQTENIHSFMPINEAILDFAHFTDEFMQRTVFHENCRSWYKNGSRSGRIAALWPGSTLHYIEALSEPRYEDWEVSSHFQDQHQRLTSRL